MNDLTITTNNVPRDVIEAYELTQAEHAEFDYYDWRAIENGEDSPTFFRYRGELHDLANFEVWTNPASPLAVGGWEAFHADTFFSGLVIRYVENFERVIVGRYYA